jgi:hypothetical protein
MGVNIQSLERLKDRAATAVYAAGNKIAPHAPRLILLAIFLGFLALRLPIRAEFLINWDAVNYALGTNFFNLEHHQPHPPGYIGYIALGWVLNHLIGEANASLTTLSVISGAAAPAALFLLASYFMSRRYAIVTAVVFGLSPLVWFYSEVALSYSLEMALALFFLWAGYQARTRMSLRHLFIATILLVFLGSVRQSGALFLMPLWLYLVWPFCWRHRLHALGLLVAGNSAWLIPLFILAGDPIAYIRASAGLASMVVVPTSIFEFSVSGLVHNAAYVLGGILIGANVGLLIIALGHWSKGRPLARLTTQDRKFFLLWFCPPLATYILVHTGQLGYMLMILPVLFLWIGMSLETFTHRVHDGQLPFAARQSSMIMLRRVAIPVVLVIIFVAANVMGFLHGPKAVYAMASSERANDIREVANELFGSLPLFKLVSTEDTEGPALFVRQYDIQTNDDYWDQFINLAETFDPDTTAVLTVVHGTGGFRHLTYYLPEYWVYGLGKDIDESFGHLFTAGEGTSDYGTEGLEEAREYLDIPDGITHLVVPDRGVIDRFAENTDGVLLTLKNETEVLVMPVHGKAVLKFVEKDDDDTRIIVEQPAESEENAPVRGSTDAVPEGLPGTGGK